MTGHNENKSNHHDNHGNDNHASNTIWTNKKFKNFLIATPLIYPFIRVQTLMQSHLTFPVGESLPNFRRSVLLAINEGGLYRGFSFFFLYSSSLMAAFSVNPLLGIAATGLLYPLELLQIYFASNAVNSEKLVDISRKKGTFSPVFYRGFLLNFLTQHPFLFFINNIKRNYVLRTDEGVKTSYREVFNSFGRDPQKLFRGGVPFILSLLMVSSFINY
jgi:hypothetical protein